MCDSRPPATVCPVVGILFSGVRVLFGLRGACSQAGRNALALPGFELAAEVANAARRDLDALGELAALLHAPALRLTQAGAFALSLLGRDDLFVGVGWDSA
jgi:hypothetical protein